MSPALHLAVEVALTTGRPLLLRGDPGTGKSSVAPYIARVLNWRYYEHVVMSTSTSTDLLWRFDAVKRLSDAQARRAKDEVQYLEPGVLWWALNHASARTIADGSERAEPGFKSNADRDQHRAVVLIDEIDKAHPDLPNGLLVALGTNQLSCPYLPDPIEIDAEAPSLPGLPNNVEVTPVQVIITTNEERELPPAFVRRCVTFHLDHPEAPELVDIARIHFDLPDAAFDRRDERLALKIAERVIHLRKDAGLGDHRPSTAEFLDAFRACRSRNIVPDDSALWHTIESVTLSKSGSSRTG